MAAHFIRPLLLLVVSATLLSGCGLLYPGWPPRPIGPVDEGMPKEIGSYASGSATMTLSGGMDEKVTLELVEGSNAMTQMGAQLQWRAPGWVLALSGYTDEAANPFGSFGSLQIDRLAEGEHWQANDWAGGCDVDFEKLDESGASGTASCRELLWRDAIMGPMNFDMSVPETTVGIDPVDVEIVFEARPLGR